MLHSMAKINGKYVNETKKKQKKKEETTGWQTTLWVRGTTDAEMERWNWVVQSGDCVSYGIVSKASRIKCSFIPWMLEHFLRNANVEFSLAIEMHD